MNGDIYVTEYLTDNVNIIPGGTGTPGTTVTVGSGFNKPRGVYVAANGDVYVADTGNYAIKRVPGGTGTPVTVVSGLGTTYATGPSSITLAQNGDLIVGQGKEVKRFDPSTGALISTLYTNVQRNIVNVFAALSGDIYWTESDQMHQVWRSPGGSGTPVSVTGLKIGSGGFVFVAANGDVYTALSGSFRLTKYASGSSVGLVVGSGISATSVWAVC